MLPKIARLQSGSSRRGRWSLILGSIALFALPTWFAAAQSQNAKPAPGDMSVSKKPAVEVKSNAPSGSTEPAAPRTPPASTTKVTVDAVAAIQSDNSQIEFFPELSKKEQAIIRELDMTTTFEFFDESLMGVRDTVMDQHRFDIVIERAKLEEESIAVDATDMTLQVKEVPLRSALRLLLQQKSLAYVIDDDVLKITTETDYSNHRLTRTYPVRDLTGNEPGDYQSLMEAIKQGVTPGAWKDTSNVGIVQLYEVPTVPAGTGKAKPQSPATCTISMVPASGSLVIHQTWRGHDEVLRLLRALRKAKNLLPTK